MPFPVFNGYNGFLDKKEKKKKIKKKKERGEEKQFPSSMTTTTMSRDMEARVYRWAPSRTRNVLSTVTVGLARKVSSTPVFRYAVRLSLSLSLSLSVLTFFFFPFELIPLLLSQVLHGASLDYYHQEQAYRDREPPARVSFRWLFSFFFLLLAA